MIVHPSSRLTIFGMVFFEIAVIAGNLVYYNAYNEFNVPLLVVPLLLVSLMYVPRLIRERSTSITVSGDVLRYQSGILSKTTRTMELRKVQDVRVDQSFGQRVLGLGDVTIQTAGETSQLTVPGI